MAHKFRNLPNAHWAAKNSVHELKEGSLEISGTISFQRQACLAKLVTFLHSAANPNGGFSRKSGFLGVPPVADRQTRGQRTERPSLPLPPRRKFASRGTGSRLPTPMKAHSVCRRRVFSLACAKSSKVADAGKWYFIIFRLRTCLGCARHGTCFVGPGGPEWDPPNCFAILRILGEPE